MAQWMKGLPYKHEGALQHSRKKLGTGTCDPHSAGGGGQKREDRWSPLASQPS